MHEIRVTAPDHKGEQVARLALKVGIPRVSVYSVFVYGPDETKAIVSAETSTPLAKAFVDELLSADWFNRREYSVTARQLRAILSDTSLKEITRPMVEPALDVMEDLWQLSHITPSYLGRAGGAAVLLAYGMLENSAISIVVAALFLPFLSEVLAVSFGAWARDWKLARQGIAALLTSTVLSIAFGACVAFLHKGTLQFHSFQPPLVSFAVSSVIGIAAGLSSADDAGRRYLIGVAAAVQYAVYPAWFGICLALGFPAKQVAVEHLTTFGLNILTIGGSALAVYACTGMRKEEVHRFAAKTR